MTDEKTKEIPDIYCNSVQMGISPYDLTIEMGLSSPPSEGETQTETVIVGKVRMSLEHAKIFAIMLRKNLKDYEDKTGGPVRVHPELLRNLGISREEDW